MNSLILKVASRFLVWLMLIFSLFVLWRGHNQPGGGFIAGIIAGSALCLYVMACGIEAAKRFVKIPISVLLALGLFLSTISAMWPMLIGKTFFTGLWWKKGLITIGTPMLFDTGVYITVVAAILLIVFALEDKPKVK